MHVALVEKEALNLSEADRALLIERLIQSLLPQNDRSEVWAQEAAARYEAFKDGEIESVDGDTFVASLRSRIASG